MECEKLYLLPAKVEVWGPIQGSVGAGLDLFLCAGSVLRLHQSVSLYGGHKAAASHVEDAEDSVLLQLRVLALRVFLLPLVPCCLRIVEGGAQGLGGHPWLRLDAY